MPDVQIVDLSPKLSVDGTELVEIQDPAGGIGSSFKTPLSNLIGPEGPPGPQGDPGEAATADAGVTTTGAPGSSAAVVNSGTTAAAVFDFTIPRGDVGPQGDPGVDGEGVPAAGTTGQSLLKASATDYDTQWGTPPLAEDANTIGGYTIVVGGSGPGADADTLYFRTS